jgi:hypothetical protein
VYTADKVRYIICLTKNELYSSAGHILNMQLRVSQSDMVAAVFSNGTEEITTLIHLFYRVHIATIQPLNHYGSAKDCET